MGTDRQTDNQACLASCLSKTGSHDGTGGCEHLRHAGTSLGALITDHNNGAYLRYIAHAAVRHQALVEGAVRVERVHL